MASQSGTPEIVPASISCELAWCSEQLTTPVIDIDLQQPLTLELMNGVKITLRPGTSLYLSPYDLGYQFGNELQDIAAKAQREEEERWLRMPEEKVKEARAAYVPF